MGPELVEFEREVTVFAHKLVALRIKLKDVAEEDDRKALVALYVSLSALPGLTAKVQAELQRLRKV